MNVKVPTRTWIPWERENRAVESRANQILPSTIDRGFDREIIESYRSCVSKLSSRRFINFS